MEGLRRSKRTRTVPIKFKDYIVPEVKKKVIQPAVVKKAIKVKSKPNPAIVAWMKGSVHEKNWTDTDYWRKWVSEAKLVNSQSNGKVFAHPSLGKIFVKPSGMVYKIIDSHPNVSQNIRGRYPMYFDDSSYSVPQNDEVPPYSELGSPVSSSTPNLVLKRKRKRVVAQPM